MTLIRLNTKMNAPLERCFELSTSIDLHKISAIKSKEEAIEGVTEGLIKLNETVTWRANHFGIWHRMKVKIIEFDKPNFFVDEMLSGSFKYMRHKHEFVYKENQTLMIDHFDFASPLRILEQL